jgi:hypothetical protein
MTVILELTDTEAEHLVAFMLRGVQWDESEHGKIAEAIYDALKAVDVKTANVHPVHYAYQDWE